MPTTIDCGPFSSTPPSDLAWDVQFGNSFFDVTIDNEGATIGLDHRLYLLEPSISQSGDLFACRLSNAVLGVVSDGFVRIDVEGMCLKIISPVEQVCYTPQAGMVASVIYSPCTFGTWLNKSLSHLAFGV